MDLREARREHGHEEAVLCIAAASFRPRLRAGACRGSRIAQRFPGSRPGPKSNRKYSRHGAFGQRGGQSKGPPSGMPRSKFLPDFDDRTAIAQKNELID